MRTFEEYITEGARWQKFMQMMSDFHDRKNIDTDFDALAQSATWAARVVKDKDHKKKLTDFAKNIKKVDDKSKMGRALVAKIERDIAPLLKAVNNTSIKFESSEEVKRLVHKMEEASKLAGVSDIPKMSDKKLLHLWNQAKDDQVSPQFGQLLKRVRMEIKKRGLKVKP